MFHPQFPSFAGALVAALIAVPACRPAASIFRPFDANGRLHLCQGSADSSVTHCSIPILVRLRKPILLRRAGGLRSAVRGGFRAEKGHNIIPRPPVYRILERVAVSCFQYLSAISNPCTVD